MISTLGSLESRVASALHDSPHLTFPSRRQLRFEAAEGKVVLRGTVRSYFQKQMAQEALRHLDGIAEIENQLEVAWA
jgi:osmotically-inducible protein OsmY